jgi:hypothetical protein
MRTWWYRIASMMSVLFALGHTYGFLRFRAPNDEGQRVWFEMNSVFFTVGSRTFSYGGFYIGFGLIISAFVVFLALLMWWMGNRVSDGIKGLRAMTWLLVGLEAAVLGLSLRFFGAGPAVLSAMAAVALARAAMSKPGSADRDLRRGERRDLQRSS